MGFLSNSVQLTTFKMGRDIRTVEGRLQVAGATGEWQEEIVAGEEEVRTSGVCD